MGACTDLLCHNNHSRCKFAAMYRLELMTCGDKIFLEMLRGISLNSKPVECSALLKCCLLKFCTNVIWRYKVLDMLCFEVLAGIGDTHEILYACML